MQGTQTHQKGCKKENIRAENGTDRCCGTDGAPRRGRCRRKDRQGEKKETTQRNKGKKQEIRKQKKKSH